MGIQANRGLGLRGLGSAGYLAAPGVCRRSTAVCKADLTWILSGYSLEFTFSMYNAWKRQPVGLLSESKNSPLSGCPAAAESGRVPGGITMSKVYVLDTNVLIQAPYAPECFEENQIVLPLAVLEELDGLKKAEGERGASARRVIRYLEQLRQKGNLLEGVKLSTGGQLRVEKNFVDVALPEDLPDSSMDNRILKVCLGLAEKESQVILVTKDILLRLKAQLLGILAQDFMAEQVLEQEKQYTGRRMVYVPEDIFKDFKKKGVPADCVYDLNDKGERYIPQLTENQFVILQADQSERKLTWDGWRKGSSGSWNTESASHTGSPQECGTVFSSGGADAAGGKGASGDRKGNGRNQQDLLFSGSGAGETAEPSHRGVPQDPDLPAQCPV